MKFNYEYLHCSNTLLESLQSEISEITSVIDGVDWLPELSIATSTGILKHQAAYNKSFENAFLELDWQVQPLLCNSPRLIGDFAKGMVFGEVHFGNSATLYRDFYKFQYGLQNGLLSLAILIVPNDEYKFFPTRPASVKNMANFTLANRCFTILPISIPTIIFGLKANDE